MPVTTHETADDEAGLRLDRWFRRHYPHLTQGALQKFCRTGQVRLDGARTEPAARLRAGQQIRVPPLPEAPAAKPRAVASPADAAALAAMLVHEDAAMIALNKPSGLPVQGGPGIRRHVDGMLEAWRTKAGRPRLVHRIDRDTSGLLLLAQTPAAAAFLAALFRERSIEKTYLAVTIGRPTPAEGRIDAPLTRAAGRTEAGDEGQAAVTDYRVLDAAGKRFALVELHPRTGRTHQLRAHMAALGTPILGDGKYAETHPEGFARLLHLHARGLVLPHPAGGMLRLEAPLPAHLAATLRQLGLGVAGG